MTFSPFGNFFVTVQNTIVNLKLKCDPETFNGWQQEANGNSIVEKDDIMMWIYISLFLEKRIV